MNKFCESLEEEVKRLRSRVDVLEQVRPCAVSWCGSDPQGGCGFSEGSPRKEVSWLLTAQAGQG